MRNQSDSHTVVDLFCGCGGLSLGFERAGFRTIRAIDIWSPAVEAYRANLADRAVQDAITEDTSLPRVSVIAGGPPCQGFSSAGRRLDGDKRNSLVAVFGKIIATHRPQAFVFENVEGFLTRARGTFVLQLLEPILEAGYHVHLRKVNAANYGVPQHRKRVIAIGGLGWTPTFPSPTHSAHGAPGAHLGGKGLPPTPTLADAIDRSDDESICPTDNDAEGFSGLDLVRAQSLKPGQRMRDLPECLWHDSYRRRAFRRVKDGTPTERRGGAPAGVRRLAPDEPSKAITGGALRDFIHPRENRPLTVRECARLQTFPDSFRFCGSKIEKVQMIGNAVPPKLAEHFAATLLSDLLLRARNGNGQEGKLLSFVPTLSIGMSPALAIVQRAVLSRFGPLRTPVQGTLWD